MGVFKEGPKGLTFQEAGAFHSGLAGKRLSLSEPKKVEQKVGAGDGRGAGNNGWSSVRQASLRDQLFRRLVRGSYTFIWGPVSKGRRNIAALNRHQKEISAGAAPGDSHLKVKGGYNKMGGTQLLKKRSAAKLQTEKVWRMFLLNLQGST